MYNGGGGHRPISWCKKLDFPDVEGDIEAEKILRMRMLKKSKRHKETTTSLFDVIKMKQKQLENGDKLSSHDQPYVDKESEHVKVIANGDIKKEREEILTSGSEDQNEGKQYNRNINMSNSHSLDIAVISGNIEIIEKGNVAKERRTHVLEGNEQQESENQLQTKLNDNLTLKNQKGGDIEIKATVTNEHVETDTENHPVINTESSINKKLTKEILLKQKKDSNSDFTTIDHKFNKVVLEEQSNTSKAAVSKDSGHLGRVQDNVKGGENYDNNNKQNDQNDPVTEIQEYVIKEGDTKLVLYRLRTRMSLINDIENQRNYNSDGTKSEESNQEMLINMQNSDKNQCQVNCDNLALDQPSNDVVNSQVSDDGSQNPLGVTGSNNRINNSNTGDGDINQSCKSDLQQRYNSQLISDSEHNGLLNASTEHTNGSNMGTLPGYESVQKVLQVRENESHLHTDKISSDIGTSSTIDQNELTHKNLKLESDKGNGHDHGFYGANSSKLDTMDGQRLNDGIQEGWRDENLNGSMMDGDKNGDSNIYEEYRDDESNEKHVTQTISDIQQVVWNRSVNSSVSKRPKRSLGNGFLVSSDVESDDDDDVKSKEILVGDCIKKDKTEMTDSKSTSREDIEQKEIDQTSQILPSTSNRQSKTSDGGGNKFKFTAGQVLIAARIRQTYDEERNRRASYVKEIGDTRKALRDLYRRLKNGEDFVVDKKMDTSDHQVGKQQEDIEKNKTDEACESVYEQQSNDCDPHSECSDNLEERSTRGEEKERENTTENDQDNQEEDDQSYSHNESANTIKDSLKSNSCISSHSSTTGKKYNVDKKVDNEWDPNHPLYEEIKNGFKSHYRKHDSRGVNNALKNLRGEYFDTSQVSPDNEYLKEARRIYPKGFRETPKTVKKRHRQLNNSSISNENENLKQGDSFKSDGDKLVTVHDNINTQRILEDRGFQNHKPITAKRKTESENKENSSIIENSKTSTPRKKVSLRSKPKIRQSNIDVDDEKLKRERKTVEKYQQLVNKTSGLPKVRSDDGMGHTQITPTNGRKTRKDNAKIPQAKFPSYQNGDVKSYTNYSDDEELDANSESDSMAVTTRESVKDKLARRASERSMGMDTRSDDVPITQAVEIVRSRQKFYNDDGEIQTKRRGHRVYKLFREIQMIRKSADDAMNPTPLVTETPDVPGSSPFLMMDYEFSTISSHRTDTDLHKFLYGSFDYDTCLRSRSLHPYSRRRDKAWNDLKQKLENRLLFSSNLKET